MKRLFALLVVVMMMALPFASAETVYTFSNPVLTVDMGETQTIDLTGLELALAGGTAGDALAVQLDISGNGAKLLGIAINMLQDRVLFTAEGLSNAYYAMLPEAAANLTNLQMPEIDTEALTQILMSGIEMDGDTIRVPYTTINEVLELLVPAFEEIEIPGVDMSQIAGAVSQLKESDSGFNVEATYGEGDSGMSLSVSASLVQGGEVAQADFVKMDAVIGETTSIDFDLAGQASFHFDMAGQTVTISANAEGTTIELKGDVGVNEADVTFTEIDPATAINAMEISDAERQVLLGELMSAASGLLPFVYSALGAA